MCGLHSEDNVGHYMDAGSFGEVVEDAVEVVDTGASCIDDGVKGLVKKLRDTAAVGGNGID